MSKMLIDPDSTGSTPLMVAARTGNGDAVKMIMQALKDVIRSPKVRQSRAEFPYEAWNFRSMARTKSRLTKRLPGEMRV